MSAWVKETNRLILELDSRSGTDNSIGSPGFSQVILDKDTFYNEEFDPGSG